MEKNKIPDWLSDFKALLTKEENFVKSYKEICLLSDKNPEYLRRVFKKHYGVSLVNHIHDLRFKKITKELIETNKLIIDIFYDCGYDNISWANVLFKRKFGMSPREYRTVNSVSLN